MINNQHTCANGDFKEKERMWAKAWHDEAQALANAEMRGEERANAKWQSVATENEELRAQLDELRAQLSQK